MFRRERPPEELVPFARFVDGLGLDELWIVEDCFWAGGLTAVGAALAVTDRIVVGMGLVPAVVRNPAIVSMEMAGLARMFPDRFVPAFGHGVADWMRQIGELPASQLAALRQIVDVVRRLLDGERVTVHDDYASLDDVQLVFPPTVRPPLLVGVTGPRSIDVAAATADGLILPEGSSPEFVRAAVARLGDRNRCAVYVLFAVDDDAEIARAACRSAVDLFAPGSSDERLEKLGVTDELAGTLGDAERIDRYAVAGTPADCAAALRRLTDAGATSLIVVPQMADHEHQLQRLVEDVLPLLT